MSLYADLKEWLEQIGMEKYLTNFIKELIFKDVLFFITESTLVDMGVTLTGFRLISTFVTLL